MKNVLMINSWDLNKFLFLFLFSTASVWAFDWQGHRGARGIYPENTIEGMKEALKYPVTTLEMDAVISKDGEVVISHEPWFNPKICSGPKELMSKSLYDLNYSQILQVNCGKDQAVVSKPSLSKLIDEIEKVLVSLNHRKVIYNVEIKSSPEQEKKKQQPAYQEFSDKVVTILESKLPHDRFVIQSFDVRVLKYMHEKYPKITLSALVEKKLMPEELNKALGFSPQIISPYHKELTAELTTLYKKAGFKVIPWTVNEVTRMREIKSWGVDGIITDYPNRIEDVLTKKTCPLDKYESEGKCRKLPKNAVQSELYPGWMCASGYVMKRPKVCEKLKIPAHALPSEDGKSWTCKEGYSRYRSKCVKSK